MAQDLAEVEKPEVINGLIPFLLPILLLELFSWRGKGNDMSKLGYRKSGLVLRQ